ncbi:MAG: winged helix-turn-helix transcriptional regulator [Hyphomicrobiales bacterium]|nr:winged helix-turn-helix transcriptional regulator [Hyphomicrobiales bacterium]
MKAVDMLKLLSNPHRLAILCHIGEEALSVNEIAEHIGMSQSALSQHLARLKNAGLVSCRREHNKIYYALSSKETESIITLLRKLYCQSITSC